MASSCSILTSSGRLCEHLKNRSPLQNKRYLIPVVYILLVALGIPWYLPPDLTILAFGFPLWALISLSVAFIIALFTAWLYLVEFTDDEP